MLFFVPVLWFHCRLGVNLLIVMVVNVVALAFPRHVRVLVVGWLCLGDGLAVAAS